MVAWGADGDGATRCSGVGVGLPRAKAGMGRGVNASYTRRWYWRLAGAELCGRLGLPVGCTYSGVVKGNPGGGPQAFTREVT